MADVSLAFLRGDRTPEALDSSHQFFFISWFHRRSEEVLQFVPKVLYRIHVRAFSGSRPIVNAMILDELQGVFTYGKALKFY